MMDPIPISRDFNSTRGFSIDSPVPGRYPGVPEQDYFAAKAVNASTLKHMGRSARHCKAAMTAPDDRPDTEAQKVGRLIHCAVLESDRFEQGYCQAPLAEDHPEALVSHEDYKARAKALGLKVGGAKNDLKARILEAEPETAFWEDLAVELVGEREALKTDHWFLARSIIDSIEANPKAASALSGGVAEETLVWQDELTGLLCKARLDYYREDLGIIFDVKTTEDARPEAVARDIHKYGYHVSAAHYMAGLEALGLPSGQSFGWVFVEKKAPHAIGLYVASADMLERGQELRRDYLTRFARCKLSGMWPAYSGEFDLIDLPAWA